MVPTLSSLGEFGLIRRLEKLLGPLSKKNVFLGIGDDTAVRKLDSHRFELWTHDLLLEKIHFLTGSLKDFEDLGWKSLAVNLSDIAAMGGKACAAIVGLGIPSTATLAQAEALYRGLKQCAEKFSCGIVGGDTNRAKTGWAIAVTVVGETPRPPLLRSGAKAGDTLWVTGYLGSAALGLEVLQRKHNVPQIFRQAQARPEPRIPWGQRLLTSGMVTSMIDISDGLAGDLGHIAEASHVGFEVDVEKIPRHPSFFKIASQWNLDGKRLLLAGGEDYELLFTVRRGKANQFFPWLKKAKIPAVQIGKAIPGKQVRFLEKGRLVLKGLKGFQHF